jgi:diguanylate cyclase (GGDEF)-like protein/PAS domain S-box-containing protein
VTQTQDDASIRPQVPAKGSVADPELWIWKVDDECGEMSSLEPWNRWKQPARQRILIIAVTVVCACTLTLGVLNAVLLGQTSAQLRTAQDQATSLAGVTRDVQLLRQTLTASVARSDEQQLADRQLAERQITVQRSSVVNRLDEARALFAPNAVEVGELEEARATVSSFPWEPSAAGDGSTSALRLAGIAQVAQVEQRLGSLRDVHEQRSYAVSAQELDTNRRNQIAVAALVLMILVLSVGGIAIANRQSRDSIAKAFGALQWQIGERQAAEHALRASEGRFRSLVQRASDLTVVTDAAGVVAYVSPAVETLLGFRPEDLLNVPLLDHMEPSERAAVREAITALAEQPGIARTIELRLRARDHRVRAVEAVCQNMLADPDVHGLVWNGRDVTDRRTLEEELIRQAHHDPLTGLANRALLLKRIGEAVHAGNSDRCVSVILVDLDGFKSVNDTLGHPAGDELLRVAAHRLLGCVREDDTAARLGGDEFAVLVSAGHPQQAVAAGQRIVGVLNRPFSVSGQEVRISASVGVAHRAGSDSAEDLLRDADIAMYVAKNAGKSRMETFAPDMRIRAARRTSLQQQLAQAVDRSEIEVHYQPIIDLTTFRPVTMEALARWRRPNHSLMQPDAFIPIAEESGAIMEIGREILRQACRAVQMWRRGLPAYAELRVAVNVSVHQVLSGSLFNHVVEALHDAGVPPATLTLEITESTALEDSAQVAAELARLQEIGVRIAVDDFGAGYSSLSFLRGLGADELKIDRTLLEFDTTRRGSLVTAVAELGRTLGLTVVVEGVETSHHLRRAREALCDGAQGYYLSRPLAVDAVPGFLNLWANGGATPETWWGDEPASPSA